MADSAKALTMLPAQRALIAHIEHLLIAPCCFTQTIDLHMSDVARDMRKEVVEKVLRGQTEQQVFDYYKAQYGERILAIPDGRLGTTAFAIPIFTSSVATSGLLYFLYRFHKRKSALRVVTIENSTRPIESDKRKQVLDRIRRDTAW